MSRQYWSGTKIDKLEENEVFVYGSNVILSSKKKIHNIVQNHV